MRKERAVILVFMLFILNSFNASAAFTRGVFPPQITNVLKYLLIDLPKNYSLPPFIIYAKLLMWILVFALLNMAAKRLPNFNKKTANIVSLILSLMSVLLMPEGVIAFIFKTYSLLITLLLALLPVGLGVWMNLGPLKGGGTSQALIRGFLWIVIGLFTIAVANVIYSYPV